MALLRSGHELFCLALPILLLAGCTTGPVSDAIAESGPNATASSGPPPAAALPLDAYEPSGAESNTLVRAVTTVTADCMAGQGFANYQPSEARAPQTTSMTRRYGVMNADDAARFGYHLTDAEKIGFRGPDDADRGELVQQAQMTAAEETALHGAPAAELDQNAPLTAGCHGEAALAVYGDRTGMPTTANLLAYRIHADSQNDGRVLTVKGEWSACMRSQGYDFAGPQDAMGSADLSVPEPSTAETSMAIADVTCKESTGLIETWLAVETELQNAAIEEQFELLSEERAQIDAMLERAAEILT